MFVHINIYVLGSGAHGGAVGRGAHGPEAAVPDRVPAVHHDPVRAPRALRHRRARPRHALVPEHHRQTATGVPSGQS